MEVCVRGAGRGLSDLALADVVHPVAIAARRTILACVSRARVRPMALALKPAVHLHRGGRLESSLPRNAVRQAHSRVVLERVRLHSIASGACSRYRSYNVCDHRLFSVRTRSDRSAILEISRSLALSWHCDCLYRASQRSKILSHGLSAAPCHNAPRFFTITKTVELVGNLRSGIAPLHCRSIGHRESP